MTQTVLLTIGRLPKALDFARSFHRAGWRVVVAEPFKQHLTGTSNAVAKSVVTPAPSAGKAAYLDALERIVREEGASLVLPLSEETMHVAHLSRPLPGGARLFAPEPERLLALHDKEKFVELAAGLGLGVPRAARLGTAEAAAIAATVDHVIKPVFSCSGKGVVFRKAGEPLPAVIKDRPNSRCVVQEKLDGAHFSTFSLAHEGQVQVTSVYRGTVMDGTVSVAFERVEAPAIEDWVSRFAAATGHSGFLSFDFITGPDEAPRAIECNPRVTSGVHYIATEALAPAILAPFTQPMPFKPTRKMQQFYPTLTEVQGSMFQRGFVEKLHHLRTSDEVTWDRADPMPFLTMPVSAWTIIAKSIAQQKRFGEVSTADISWFEDDRL